MAHYESDYIIFNGIQVWSQDVLDKRTIIESKEDLVNIDKWPHVKYNGDIDPSSKFEVTVDQGGNKYIVYVKAGMTVTVTGTKDNPVFDQYILTDVSKMLGGYRDDQETWDPYIAWKFVGSGSSSGSTTGNIDGGRADERYAPHQTIKSGDAAAMGESADDRKVISDRNTADDEGNLIIDQNGCFTEKYDNFTFEGEINLMNVPLKIENNRQVKIKLRSGSKIIGGLFTENGGSITPGNSDSYCILVNEGSTLTIDGDGEMEAQDAKYSMAIWANGGNVIIKGGKYINNGDGCDLIYASNGGKVTIEGGTFIATSRSGEEEGTKNSHSALNIKDKDRDTSWIRVKGGEFYQFDPGNNLSEGPETSFLVNGYKSVKSGDYYAVIKE